MATINEVIRERRKMLAEVQKWFRSIDTQVEDIQRKLTQVRARKTKIPEDEDIEMIIALGNILWGEVDDTMKKLAQLISAWTI